MDGPLEAKPATPPSVGFGTFVCDRPLVMGVVNVTPDSFSDGGTFLDGNAAIDHGLRLMAEGADIIDVGGESTRPGAHPIAIDEERRRVIPVVRALAAANAVVSIDTRHAPVMAAAIDAGAAIVNDITALTGDADALPLVAGRGMATILMHMQGDPRTMQAAPRYDNVAVDVHRWLAGRVIACEDAGIPRQRLAVDPGIGFGKTVAHNLAILSRLDLYRDLGCALAIGVSRKSFIGHLSRGEPPSERLAGSLAAALAAVHGGARIIRVHDVAATRQALAVWQEITRARGSD